MGMRRPESRAVARPDGSRGDPGPTPSSFPATGVPAFASPSAASRGEKAYLRPSLAVSRTQRKIACHLGYEIVWVRHPAYIGGDMARHSPDASAKDEKRAMWYLRKIPLLEGVPADRLTQLSQAVEIREIPRRQVIYLPGDPGDRVFFINGGRVKCSKVTRDGKELTLAYRGAGQMFGELCIVEGTPRDEMAEAMKNAIITELPRELFRELLLSEAQLAFNFAIIVGERRRQIETKLEHLVFRDVQAKLAALLLELGEEYG